MIVAVFCAQIIFIDFQFAKIQFLWHIINGIWLNLILKFAFAFLILYICIIGVGVTARVAAGSFIAPFFYLMLIAEF